MMKTEIARLVELIRELYPGRERIALHEPVFVGREREYVLAAIDSTYVSSVGAYVDRFERMLAEAAGTAFAVATVNGTSALHAALVVAGVRSGDRVLTQPLSFVATCNAIHYCRAEPVFLDVDPDTAGLSPAAVASYLKEHCVLRDGQCVRKSDGGRVSACVPMHTFGLPGRAAELAALCAEWGIVLVEDAAEALGSRIGDRRAGAFGRLGIFSFNGNKTVTCGGGGAIVTDDPELARRAKHLTTTAKVPHRYEFFHDEAGFNYRMPNINAALACAQLEQLPVFLANKRETARRYAAFFADGPWTFLRERPGTNANYWLNAVRCRNRAERDELLRETNDRQIMTRPAWRLLSELPMYRHCFRGALPNAEALAEQLVNLPSGVRPETLPKNGAGI